MEANAKRSVTERIKRLIRDRGPIPFSLFMEEALYGEGGFYASPPIGSGSGSAFVTSPHIHPVFGQLLGAAVAEIWDLLGRPSPFRLVEIGAGDGTLARQLIEALGPLREIRYTAVERSAGARGSLEESDVRVTKTIERDGADVFIANELLDNLPFDLSIDGSRVDVGLDGEGRFVPLVDDRAIEHIDRAGVVPVGAIAMIDQLADAMSVRPSYSLLIDYGGIGTSAGPVHGYRAHQEVEDVLDEPGSADITAGVDFDAISRRARDRGLMAHEPISQRQALIALGIEGWIKEELQRQRNLLEERDGVAAVRAWSGRSRATLLVGPAGLGRLRWLLLSTKGLPVPSWLRA